MRAGRKAEDEQLLNRPERARPAATDFTQTDPWRVLRILGELVAGFDALAEVDAAVAVFGRGERRPSGAAPDAARTRDPGRARRLAGSARSSYALRAAIRLLLPTRSMTSGRRKQ
ncbi:hypothetical protein WMF39_08550 [Sorangium sp. So ce1504]|uniref:hypothetical protein n=1 Tax=Sorangium sp. So ce1504 TaxID=3133337 RepID=UPI003F63CE78